MNDTSSPTSPLGSYPLPSGTNAGAAPPAPGEPSLTVRAVSAGRIMSRTMSVLMANLGKVLGVTTLVHLPSLLFMLYVVHSGVDMTPTRGNPVPHEVSTVQTVLNLVLTGIAAAPVTYLVFQHLRGQPATLGEAIRQGLRRIVPAVLASFAITIVGGFAAILLVIPGIIWFSMSYVTIPAVVIERIGVGAALTRSQKLTEGYRMSIFGFFVLLMIGLFLCGVVIGLLDLQDGSSSAATVANWVLTTLFAAVSAVATAVTYHDLRVSKEGAQTEELARVFD